MDDLKYTRCIRADVDGIDPKAVIILVTETAGEKIANMIYAAGVDLFPEKPVSVKIPRAGVESVLGRT